MHLGKGERSTSNIQHGGFFCTACITWRSGVHGSQLQLLQRSQAEACHGLLLLWHARAGPQLLPLRCAAAACGPGRKLRWHDEWAERARLPGAQRWAPSRAHELVLQRHARHWVRRSLRRLRMRLLQQLHAGPRALPCARLLLLRAWRTRARLLPVGWPRNCVSEARLGRHRALLLHAWPGALHGRLRDRRHGCSGPIAGQRRCCSGGLQQPHHCRIAGLCTKSTVVLRFPYLP
jgi:hypothetical protein